MEDLLKWQIRSLSKYHQNQILKWT